MTTATLIVADWQSRCSACGGNAHPSDIQHYRGGPHTNPMKYDDSTLDQHNGCRATFVSIGSDRYSGVNQDMLRRLRPDLEVLSDHTY